MSSAVTANVVDATTAPAVTGYGTLNPQLNYKKTFANGNGDFQVNQEFFGDFTVTTGTPKVFDLIGGGMSQPDGTAFAPTAIKIFELVNNSDTDTLSVGGGSNQWATWLGDPSDIVKIPPGGKLKVVAPKAGYAVTAGTGDNLQITSSGTATSATIALVGCA